MANIDNELDTILHAGKGEEVRSAIYSALMKIHNEKEYPPTTLKVISNGTYEETGMVWNKVIVDVPEGGSNINNIDDLGEHIVDNGYYSLPMLKEMGYITNPECVGINGFFVEVPQTAAKLGEINITANGEYDPLQQGYDGYSRIYVNVVGNGSPGDSCTLRFFDIDGSLLQQKVVPYGSEVVYDGATPSHGTGVFTGWNPSVSRVTGNQDFRATYNRNGGVAGEIVDDWRTIAAKMKARKMEYTAGAQGDANTAFKTITLGALTVSMYLIGYELDDKASGGKAWSTWVGSITPIKSDYIILPHCWFMNELDRGSDTRTSDLYRNAILNATGSPAPVALSWKTSLLRAHLNDDPSDIAVKAVESSKTSDLQVYNNCASTRFKTLLNTGVGFDLFSLIERVQKLTKSGAYTNPRTSSAYLETIDVTKDKVWITSGHEGNSSTTPPDKGATYAGLINEYSVITRDYCLSEPGYEKYKNGQFGAGSSYVDVPYGTNNYMYNGFSVNIGFCL